MIFVKIKTQFEGFHKYSDAPNDVDFLRDLHRHTFNVSVKIQVNHNNRDIEFIQLKRKVDALINLYINKRDAGSCEMIAEKLLELLKKDYKDSFIEVSIGEDGEFEGIVNNI